MAKAFTQADEQGVVPRGPRRLNVFHLRGAPTLEGDAERNIIDGIGRLAANRIRGACELCLIDGPFTDQVEPSCPGVSDIQNEALCQLRLQAQAVFLRHRRAETRIKRGNRVGRCGRREVWNKCWKGGNAQ